MESKKVNRIHIGGTLKEIVTIIPEHKTFITLEVTDKINERIEGKLVRYPYNFFVMVWLDEKLLERLEGRVIGSQITVSGKLLADNTIKACYINPFTANSEEPFFPTWDEIQERKSMEQQQSETIQ